jgi:predicted component of type VI protein secretion system
MDSKDALPQYIELLALTYHEARHVRQLFRHNAASTQKFGALADHLGPDANQAWTRLIPAQQRAAEAASAKDADAIFVESFRCAPADVAAMFTSPAWKRIPMYGGARWAAIARAVVELGALIDAGSDGAGAKIDEIMAMRHNTGSVRDKLARLKGDTRK